MPGAGRRSARAATLVGLAVSFVVAVDLARWLRPLPLTDPDPLWALPRLLLGLFVVAASASAGGLVCALCLLWFRHSLSHLDPAPLPFDRSGLVVLAAAALVAGTFLRFVDLGRLPPSLWIDDVSLIAPALALQGAPADFANTIRPAPFGVAKPYGSVGVLYLELYRGALSAFGVNVFGVRFLSAAAGVLSLLTALLLARELLPPGGGPLAALILAGLRWNLLFSRWGWNAIVLAPILDVAAWLLLRARRRESLRLAGLAGLVAGLATHIYLASWVGAAALLALALWPPQAASSRRTRLLLPLVFAGMFACATAPLFLFKQGRIAPYFARASDHSLLKEIGYWHSLAPAFEAAADSLAAPWFGVDPFRHQDLPGKTRLDWILGPPVALALARSLLRARETFSAFLLCHGGAAFAASIAGGHAGVPNSYRFGYLSNVTAVAAAGGMLCLLSLLSPPRRREGAFAVLGLIALSGTLGARDALLRWPERQETFDGFHGQDTLLARALLRWQPYGRVVFLPGLEHSGITVEGIFRYRLDPGQREGRDRAARIPSAGAGAQRLFRLVSPGTAPASGERLVERIDDAWGRSWGVVLARRAN